MQLLNDGGRIEKGVLDTNDAFIMDCVSEIYPWTGKKCDAGTRAAVQKVCRPFKQFRIAANVTRTNAIKIRGYFLTGSCNCCSYLRDCPQMAEEMAASRSFWTTPIVRIIEEAEPIVFKYKCVPLLSAMPRPVWSSPLLSFSSSLSLPLRFSDWGGGPPIAVAAPIVGLNTAAVSFQRHRSVHVRADLPHPRAVSSQTKEQHHIDVSQYFAPKKHRVDVMVDDGSGEVRAHSHQ